MLSVNAQRAHARSRIVDSLGGFVVVAQNTKTQKPFVSMIRCQGRSILIESNGKL